jgi:hypothetical protein
MQRVPLLLFGALAMGAAATEGRRNTAINPPPNQDVAYDLDAFYIPPELALNLSQLVTLHRVVRLGAFDYSHPNGMIAFC